MHFDVSIEIILSSECLQTDGADKGPPVPVLCPVFGQLFDAGSCEVTVLLITLVRGTWISMQCRPLILKLLKLT